MVFTFSESTIPAAEASLLLLFTPDKSGKDNAHNEHQQPNLLTLIPHTRTLRKAREQVKAMVNDGISFRRISSYLKRWAKWWWVQAGGIWTLHKVYCAFLLVCWDKTVAAHACGFIPNSTYDAYYFFCDEFSIE